MLTIAPWPACCMCGMAARQSQATAVRLTRSTRSQTAVSNPPAGLRPPLAAAALLTRTVRPPSRSAAVSTSVPQAVSSARSAATNTALPPAPVIVRTTAAPRPASRPCTQTRAPSRAHRMAVCWPIPEVDPVTRTRSPASRIGRSASEPVGGLQLGVLGGQHLRQAHHHLALLPGGVVLHLAVDHVDAAAVGDGLEHLLREQHLRSEERR